MSSYVNLLSEDEIHYHSAATDNKKVKYGMYGVGTLILLICAISYLSYQSSTGKAAKLRKRWAAVEPIYEAAIKNKAELKSGEAMVAEIKGWPQARLLAADLLTNLQDAIPAEMQVTRLTLKGTILGVESAGRREFGSPRKKVSEPQRLYSLRIEGNVVDEFGEKIILNFVRTLQEDPNFLEYFESVDFKEALPTVIPHYETGKDRDAQRFSIECQFKPRKVKWTGKA